MNALIILIVIAATAAGAVPATNRMAEVKAHTNRVQHIEGKRQVIAIYKTQPKDRIRVKNANGKVIELPLMFDNNKINLIRERKENKK